MKNIQIILKSAKKNHVYYLFATTIAISLLAAIDVLVIDKMAKIGKVADQIQIINIAAAMIFRSIANIALLHAQSYFSFKVYHDLVESRYSDIVINSFLYEKSKLINYVGNESLQAVLTVLLPFLALATSIFQIFILTVGTVYVSGNLLLEIALPIAALYAIYIIPMQYILNKRGMERRAADEARSDYLNSAIKSLDEVKYYEKKNLIKERYILSATKTINRGLTLKWANSEGQKSVLELCGVIGIALWYIAARPGAEEIAAVSGLIFLFYRIAPLITRIAIAYQSLIYGRASTDPPKKNPNGMSFDLVLNGKEIKFKSKENEYQIDIQKKCITLLMGPSGVGKSTLLREMAEVISCTGVRMGFVGQTPLVLNGDLYDNFFEDKKEIEREINEFGLDELKEETRILSSTSVSGGEAMRISLLRNCLAKPDILLIDEPFAALDAENKEKIAEMLNKFSQTRPVICVTHEIPTNLKVKNVIQLG